MPHAKRGVSNMELIEFKKMYDNYWRIVGKPNPQYTARMCVVVEMIQSGNIVDNMLEVGCGVGFLTRLISKRAKNIVAFDISINAIRRARNLVDIPEYVLADCRYLPFRDYVFDMAVASEIIEHIPRPERMLKELHQVIRRKGCLVISTPNRRRIGQRLAKLVRIVLPLGQHLQEYDLNEFTKQVSDASFEIISLKTDYIGFALPTRKLSVYFGSKRLARYFPNLSTCFVIMAGK